MTTENIIYGLRPVMEAIESDKTIDKVLLQRGLQGDLFKELFYQVRQHKIPFQYVPAEKLNKFTRGNHQGVVAFVSAIEYQSIFDIVPQIFEEGRVPFLLMLDKITDVRNIGAIARSAECAGVDAIIASDMAAILYCRRIGLEVHISTQLSISNLEALRFYAQFADVVVLARELHLDQVKAISEAIEREQITGPSGQKVRIEMFAHGAMCMAISGKCYLSLDAYGKSANRGGCYQVCRRGYEVKDVETGHTLLIDNQYIMSPKDLCTIGFLDRIVASRETV